MKKTKTAVKELPGMPEKSDLQNHCDNYLQQHERIETAKTNMELIGDMILSALRTEKRDSLTIQAADGSSWKFSISQSRAKVKAKRL